MPLPFRRSTSHPLPVLTLVVLAAVGCGDGGSGPDVQPSSVVDDDGNGQTGPVGEALPRDLTVLVTGTDGEPFAGAAVEWAVTSGGGTVAPDQGTTGADGRASTTWTLGTTPGQQTVTATVPGLTPTTFTATAEAGDPAEVTVTPADPTLEALQATVALEAELRDAFGNSLTAADFAWSSADEGVAVVDEDTGVTTAVAPGTAEVTATEGGSGLTGSVTVTVDPVPASVEVTPVDPEVPEGTTLQLAAAVADANDHPVPDATVVWTSNDEAVATVDGTGLVTGVAEGQATVTATAGEASADVTVTVTFLPEDFDPEADQDVEGSLVVGNLTLREGVTLTATGDLEIHAYGDVSIDGTITGDCVAISVVGDGDLTVSGLVENECSAGGPEEAPSLVIRAGGAMALSGAELGSSGATTVTNEPAASPPGASWTDDRVPTAAAAQGTDCTFDEVLIRSTDRPDGADGEPRGEDGTSSPPQTVACAGTARFAGRNTAIFGHDGGRGGAGSSSGEAPAIGGSGGRGGDAVVRAGGDIVVDGVALILESGNGGRGGIAVSEAYPRAEAMGGPGGPPGLPRLVAGGTVRTMGGGEIDVEVGTPGGGGEAAAMGSDGTDATASAPATPGGDAVARGGDGASWGGEGVVNLIDDLIQGALDPGATVHPRGVTIFRPDGGSASTRGGDGGAGSREYPDGADGGDQIATGGVGGSVNVFDNRTTPVPFSGMQAGKGGSLYFERGTGGGGADRCMVLPVESGGAGGAGGDLAGSTGEGGAEGASGRADPGDAAYLMSANGGAGGDGHPPGSGGAAGSDDLVVVGGALDVDEPSLEDGPDGQPCVTAFDVGIAVDSDPNGHEPFIMMTGVEGIRAVIDEDGMITFTSTNPTWIEVMGSLEEDGTFTTTGVGVAAGFQGVPVGFEGTIQTDEDGTITGLTGTLTVDTLNTVLPPDQDGERHPAVYTVTGTKASSTAPS